MNFDSGIEYACHTFQKRQAGQCFPILDARNRGLACPYQFSQLRLGESARDTQAGDLIARFKFTRDGGEFLALNLLAHGVDISTLEEVLMIRESTIRSWLTRSGVQGRKLHERFFVNLELTHVQLDELWAKVKQAQLEVWVWVACEAKTKIVPVIQVGARTQDMAYSVVHELKTRMKADCVPVFSSDGLKHYFYALTAHFGEWICPDGETNQIFSLPMQFCAKMRPIGHVLIINHGLWLYPKNGRMNQVASTG